jgi:transcriptional regulator with XRE-family HTH domain
MSSFSRVVPHFAMQKTITSRFHQRLVARIRRERLARNLRQADVAERCGMPLATLSQIEIRQRRVDVYEYTELAKAIGFDAVAILVELLQNSK